MWKPRNKWQLQTKGGCENSSSGGGSSSDSRIVIRGTVTMDANNPFKFEPIAPNLEPEQLLLADVIAIHAPTSSAIRDYVYAVKADDALAFYLNTNTFGKLLYVPLAGTVEVDGSGEKPK